MECGQDYHNYLLHINLIYLTQTTLLINIVTREEMVGKIICCMCFFLASHIWLSPLQRSTLVHLWHAVVTLTHGIKLKMSAQHWTNHISITTADLLFQLHDTNAPGLRYNNKTPINRWNYPVIIYSLDIFTCSQCPFV